MKKSRRWRPPISSWCRSRAFQASRFRSFGLGRSRAGAYPRALPDYYFFFFLHFLAAAARCLRFLHFLVVVVIGVGFAGCGRVLAGEGRAI